MIVALDIQHTTQTLRVLTFICKCQGLLKYLFLNQVPGMFTSSSNFIVIDIFCLILLSE